MTGYARHNFPAFDHARDCLVMMGWRVLSPADIDRKLGVTERSGPRVVRRMMKRMMRADINAVLQSDAIYMLKGWEKSVGARAEHALAIWNGATIVYENDIVFPGDIKCK